MLMKSKKEQLFGMDINNEANRLFGVMKTDEPAVVVETRQSAPSRFSAFCQKLREDVFTREI